MSRFTIKNQLKNGLVEYLSHETRDADYACIQKLGRYEDIEEDLGIDLTILIKAQTNGFYIKSCLGIKKVNLSDFKFNLAKKEVHRIAASQHFFFKDYGKTWALTKEELE